MWSCLDYISIGDYEEHLEAWNRMGLLDYKLSLSYRPDLDDEFPQKAIIIVKNGIPESSDPPSWLTRGEKSTIPDFYSFIKNEEKRLQKVKHLKKSYLKVKYNIVYHYPSYISFKDYTWEISLTSLNGTE